MKIVIAALSLFVSSTLVHAADTSKEVVGQINVEASPSTGKAYYYFQSVDGNWSSTQCPNAEYVYVPENMAGADKMFELALDSKNTHMPIKFHGICGDTGGNTRYIQGRYATY